MCKILTLYQPWASAVAIGVKRHETRGHRIGYTGPVLIHAARDTSHLQRARKFNTALAEMGLPTLPHPFPLGAVVASAVVVYWGPTDGFDPVRPCDDADRMLGDWRHGRYAALLADIRPLPEPVPWVGRQGLRGVPPELLQLVEAQIGCLTG